MHSGTFWGNMPYALMCVRCRHQYHWRQRPVVDYWKVVLLWDRRRAVGAKRVENGVNAIQKWVPFTPKCSQKLWRLGLRSRPPLARESLVPSKALSLMESAFDACQSDTPRGRGANSHLRPGRHKPSVRRWWGLGWSPSRQRFWCYFWQNKTFACIKIIWKTFGILSEEQKNFIHIDAPVYLYRHLSVKKSIRGANIPILV